MVMLLLAVAMVLIASAICSGSEAALFSVPPVKVTQASQQGSYAGKALLQIRENMERPIATIVIFNNIANIVGSIWLGYLSSYHLTGWALSAFPIVLTFLVIIFSEIIPKTMGERYSFQIAMVIARPLGLVCLLMTPILFLLERITAPFASGEQRLTTNESEIKLLASIGHTEGVIERDELRMLQNVFTLNDLKAVDLMTPRVAVSSLQVGQTLDELKDEIANSPHTRLILYDKSLDDIKGVVFRTDCLKAMVFGEGQRMVEDFCKEVSYVPESLKADRLLDHFRATRRHLAVVGDEFGGVRGIITLEDVVEVLTGQIVDETDLVVDLQLEARKAKRQDPLSS
jgi:CBS domain containing-hemolysin-like protein